MEVFIRLNVKEISYIGVITGLLLTFKWLESFTPSLPNGMGKVADFLQIGIIIASTVLGFKISFVSTLSYLIITFAAPSIYIEGIAWVNGNLNRFGVYMLDYFLPLIALTFIALGRKNIRLYVLMLVLVNLFNYLCHILSGYIFWSSWHWTGWGPWTYSIAYNGVRNGIMFACMLVIIPFAYKMKGLYKVNGWVSENRKQNEI